MMMRLSSLVGPCLLGCALWPADAVSPLLVPAQGAWWGIYAPASAAIGWNYDTALTTLESDVGRHFDIVHRYHDMSNAGSNGAFPDSYEQAEAASGHFLFFAWESRTYATGIDYTWPQITSGALDAVIDATIARIKALPYQVFIDFDHEPEADTADGSDADFVAAYRYIVTRFRAEGATNALWIWTVEGWSGAYSRYLGLYPGDDVVDWIAYDPYNWNGWGGHGAWNSFSGVVQPFYSWLAANSAPGHAFSSKPYMLAEYGSADNLADPLAREAWYDAIPAALKTMPNLKAVVYFDSSVDADWRFETTPQSITGFAAAGQDPYLNQPHTTPPVASVAPSITTQPMSVSVLVGQSATFTVVAGGTPAPTYQWRRDGATIVGATAATYATPATAAADTGASFTCIISNSAGTVPSNAAVLTVATASGSGPTATSGTGSAGTGSTTTAGSATTGGSGGSGAVTGTGTASSGTTSADGTSGSAAAPAGSSGGCGLGGAGALLVGSVLTLRARRRAAGPRSGVGSARCR